MTRILPLFGEPVSRNLWGILFDSTYKGLQREVRAFIPIKKPSIMSAYKCRKKLNADVSSDRVVVKSWFNRLVSLWWLILRQCRWSKNKNNIIFTARMALNNFNIIVSPVRNQNNDTANISQRKHHTVGSIRYEPKRTSWLKFRKNCKRRITNNLAGTLSHPNLIAVSPAANKEKR